MSPPQDTKLAATSEEEAAWLERTAAHAGASTSSSSSPGGGGGGADFHFVCEAFFMTLKSLHLGLVKVVSEGNDEMRRLQDLTRMQQEMEAALARWGAERGGGGGRGNVAG